MKINTKTIQAELRELAGKGVKVRLHRQQDVACHIRQTDRGFDIQFNPSKIRSPQTLEAHVQFCREAVID